jgi:glycosyltransferase involved in cell wall biosynthesis
MRVWIVSPYSNLPSEAWRKHRGLLLAEALAAAGHGAVLWISNIEHHSRGARKGANRVIPLSPALTVRIVESTPYRSNVSLARFRYEREFGRKFLELAAGCEAPDVLVLIEPALFFGEPVVDFCRANRVPLIVDVVDLWPEAFEALLPRALRGVARLLFRPMYRHRAELISAARGLVAASEHYMAAVEGAFQGRLREVIYLGIDPRWFEGDAAGSVSLPAKRIGETWFVYAGSLGQMYDLQTLLRAARVLERQGLEARIFIAGDGPSKERILRSIDSLGLGRVHFLGVLTPEQLSAVYRQCDIGLAMYKKGSTVSFPLKAFDYLGAGLPIVHSLPGAFDLLVSANGAGCRYSAQSTESLAAVLAALCRDPARCQKLREAALTAAREYDISTQYGRYLRLIEAAGSPALVTKSGR